MRQHHGYFPGILRNQFVDEQIIVPGVQIQRMRESFIIEKSLSRIRQIVFSTAIGLPGNGGSQPSDGIRLGIEHSAATSGLAIFIRRHIRIPYCDNSTRTERPSHFVEPSITVYGYGGSSVNHHVISRGLHTKRQCQLLAADIASIVRSVSHVDIRTCATEFAHHSAALG